MINTKIEVKEKPGIYTFEGKKYKGLKYSWLQMNRKTKEIVEKGGKIEYLGEKQDASGQLYCSFRELKKEPGKHSFKEGNMFFVNNDVVFDFQIDPKPVPTGGKKVPKESDYEGD